MKARIATSTADRISVFRPTLPTAELLRNDLERIDRNRHYSNFGPVHDELRHEIAQHFSLDPAHVVLVANATVGLTLAIQASGRQGYRYCIVPAWTFAASAHAIIAAGYTPYFVDVDPSTWALDPELLLADLAVVRDMVAAVLVVAPFGAPIDTVRWDEFTEATGIPVIIDAAAAFDTCKPGQSAAVVSMHATKPVAAGEGGFVVTNDAALAIRILRMSNFGFDKERNSILVGLNAKISEYHAAVGKASLASWNATRKELARRAVLYRSLLTESGAFSLQRGLGTDWVSSTLVLKANRSNGAAIERVLSEAGVETRRWWGYGVHRHAAFCRMPKTNLPVTDFLASHTIGLPFYQDLTLEAVEYVAAIINASA